MATNNRSIAGGTIWLKVRGQLWAELSGRKWEVSCGWSYLANSDRSIDRHHYLLSPASSLAVVWSAHYLSPADEPVAFHPASVRVGQVNEHVVTLVLHHRLHWLGVKMNLHVETTHKGIKQHSKGITQTQQQRHAVPTVTLTWHASNYKGHKIHHRYILWSSIFAFRK